MNSNNDNYWFSDNWSGKINYFEKFSEAKKEAKKQTGISVSIHNKNGIAAFVKASGYIPS